MFCQPYPEVTYLIYSEFAPHLLYYSHIPAAIVALLLSGFVFFQNRKVLEAKILAIIAVMFSVWSVADLFIWTQTNSAIITYLWSFWYSFLCLLFVLNTYFLYVFTQHKDIPFKYKVVGVITFLPTLVISFLGLDFSSFNITGCNAVATPLVLFYTYGISCFYFIVTVIFSIKVYITAPKDQKNRVFLASAGVLFFLISFSISSYIADIASLFEKSANVFNIEQYGYFGMTIMIGLLTYTVVRYKAFNVKLLATQALVFGLVILIGSQFFFIKSNVNRVLNGITFVLSIGFGSLLTKSVKKEVEAKESVQRLAIDLEKSNTRLKELDIQKTEFISFATHQLRSPLTSIKGNSSLILEGDLGPVPTPVKDVVQTIFTSIKTMVNIVDDYLNVSRIELGTMKYTLVDMDFKDLFRDVMNEQKVNIESKGLTYSVFVDETQTYKIKADPDKFKQVVMNTIDNSIKYTPQGSLTISLSKDDKKKVICLKIADTGVGIKAEVMPKLFRKFSRAPDASAANIHGTGLGLFIAKEIMNAHGGKIWAESEGEGKGSQFYVEMPEVK